MPWSPLWHRRHLPIRTPAKPSTTWPAAISTGCLIPLEQKRRRVTVQVWAEALRNERVASIVRDGVGQRHQVADFVRERQHRGELIAGVDADALSRAMLSLILGFVLQQAWDPVLDVDGYRTVLDAMIDQFLLVDADEELTGSASSTESPGPKAEGSHLRIGIRVLFGHPDRAGSGRATGHVTGEEAEQAAVETIGSA